jgi:hypothetical protein
MTCREDGCKRKRRPSSPYCQEHFLAVLHAAPWVPARVIDLPLRRLFLSDLEAFKASGEPAVVARENPPSPSTSGGLSGRLGRHGHVGDTGAPATE